MVLCCVVCVVWCVARLGTQKKPSCVDSKRPRVYRHHAHMCYHMCAWFRYTRGRFESTHEGFLDGHTGERRGEEGEGREGHRQFCSPKFAHKLSRASERFTERNPWFLPIQGLRTGQEQHVPESSNHSLYLMKLLRDTAEGISTHNTHKRTNTYPRTHPPPLPSPPYPPSPTRTRTRKRTCACTCICTCTCICACVYMHV